METTQVSILKWGKSRESTLYPRVVKRAYAKTHFLDWVWEVYDKEEETRDFLTWICDPKTISQEANILTNEEVERWEKLKKESPNSILSGQRLKDAIEIALDQGDEDLCTVSIGKLFLEASPMLGAFKSYCTRQVIIKPNIQILNQTSKKTR